VGEDVGESATTTLEGVLRIAKGGDKRDSAPALFLRLPSARCVVGFARASYVSEVWIATTGVDLRPFVDTRVRLTGEAIAGTSDMGEAAIVLLVRDVDRAPPREEP
jgi:hypothetical protein